jgi:hypothetical protein
VDPRYAEAVKKERLAMQAVMDQRRKMAEFYEQVCLGEKKRKKS